MTEEMILEELSSEGTLTQPSSRDLPKDLEVSNNSGFDTSLIKKLIRISDDCFNQTTEYTSDLTFIESAETDIYQFAYDGKDHVDAARPSQDETAKSTFPFETPFPRQTPSAKRGKKHKKATTSQHASTKLLHKLRNKNGRPLKKENLRYQIVRGSKKCGRRLANESSREQIPQKGIHQVDKKDGEQMKVWKEMKEMVVYHESYFSSFGSTVNGPKSDARTIRKGEANEKSCNDRYCQLLYSSPLACKFHYLYVKLVYGTGPVSPANLCKKLSAYCCAGKHTAHCSALWKQLKQYFMFEMLKELDCEPYDPQERLEYFLQNKQ